MSTPPHTVPGINRRQFLVLTALAVVAGRQTLCIANASAGATGERVVNAGPVSRYAADGQYDYFLDDGFFVVRQGEKLFALSSECTHRQCKLKVGSHRSFYCPCHGSTFDPGGKVTEGPAKHDLPILPSTTNADGHLLVTVPAV